MAKKLVFLIVIVAVAALFLAYGQDITGLITGQPSQPSGQPADQPAGNETDAGNLTGETSVYEIRTFLKDYASSHDAGSGTGSSPGTDTGSSDFSSITYSCLQLQDALVSAGIETDIVLGSIETAKNTEPNEILPENFTMLNRAWLMLMAGPTGRLAVETDGFRIMDEDSSPLYYEGYSFSDPADFREYLSLLDDYESAAADAEGMQAELNQCFAELGIMIDEYNRLYGGRPMTDKSAEEQAMVFERRGRCNAISELLGRELQSLSYQRLSTTNHLAASAAMLV